MIYLSSALNKDKSMIFSNYQWRYYTISTTWYYEMYSPTMLINYLSFKLNRNVLYQRKIIDKYKKTSNFDPGFPKFADRGKPSLGCQQPKMNVFTLWLNFALIAHFCYSFCYSFFSIFSVFQNWRNPKENFSKKWILKHQNQSFLFCHFP